MNKNDDKHRSEILRKINLENQDNVQKMNITFVILLIAVIILLIIFMP